MNYLIFIWLVIASPKSFWCISEINNSDPFDRSGIDWIYCRDGKHRPIEPGIKPLVNGLPKGMVYIGDSSIAPNETQEARVMRLKGYGNAIVPQVAAEFIIAFAGMFGSNS